MYSIGLLNLRSIHCQPIKAKLIICNYFQFLFIFWQTKINFWFSVVKKKIVQEINCLWNYWIKLMKEYLSRIMEFTNYLFLNQNLLISFYWILDLHSHPQKPSPSAAITSLTIKLN